MAVAIATKSLPSSYSIVYLNEETCCVDGGRYCYVKLLAQSSEFQWNLEATRRSLSLTAPMLTLLSPVPLHANSAAVVRSGIIHVDSS